MSLPDHLIDDGTKLIIVEDQHGWFNITQSGRTLQGFRTVHECTTWIRSIRWTNANIEIRYRSVQPKF